MLLMVGLGNPGPGYAGTRHNLGYLAADAIAAAGGFRPWRARFSGLLSEGALAGERVLMLKPVTWMNASGRSVAQAVRFYKLPVDRVTVLHDDLDLRPGKVRIKRGGGPGGHNGLRSLDAHIGRDYWRVRMGIGHPGDRDRVLDYVLRDFPLADRRGWVDRLVAAIADEAGLLAAGEHNAFMSRVAHAVFPPPPRPAKPPAGPAAAPKAGEG